VFVTLHVGWRLNDVFAALIKSGLSEVTAVASFNEVVTLLKWVNITCSRLFATSCLPAEVTLRSSPNRRRLSGGATAFISQPVLWAARPLSCVRAATRPP